MRIAYRSMVKQIIVTEALLYQNALQYIKSTCIAMCIVQCTSKQHRAMMIDGGKGKLSFKDVKGWLQSTSVTRFPLFLGTIPPPHLKLPPSWADATFPRMSSVSQCVVALPATCIPLHPTVQHRIACRTIISFYCVAQIGSLYVSSIVSHCLHWPRFDYTLYWDNIRLQCTYKYNATVPGMLLLLCCMHPKSLLPFLLLAVISSVRIPWTRVRYL